MRAIRWPFWAILGAGFAAWLVLGLTLPQSVNLNDVFNVAAVATFLAAALFIVVWTVAGLTGPRKWWTNNVGTYLVLAAASVLCIVGPIAYAVAFHHGVLNTWWLAWCYVGGHFLAAAVWALLGWLWVRQSVNGSPG